MTRRPARPSVLATALISLLVAHHAAATTAPSISATDVQRGRYLAIAGDCEACHTTPGATPFSGGLPVETPIGPIYSTNITPSQADGIGSYSLQQFSDAVRKGIRADGERLYPAMPYTAYAQVTDTDIRALYAYFMHAIQPVDIRGPSTRLPFPFDLRASMAIWDFLFLDTKVFAYERDKSSEWNRGAYLTRGLAHCGTCHTPRNWLMAEDSSRTLAGGSLGTWFAPNITPNTNSGIGEWSVGNIVEYLKLGAAPGKAQAAGPMAEAVDHSLRHLTNADLAAVAVYLKSVRAQQDPKETRPADSWGEPYADLASLRGSALPDDSDRMTGPQLYDAYCATCHQDRGQGSFDGGLPPLFHNTATGRRDTDNLVMTMLDGIEWHTDGSGVRMPAFARALSDRQIATLGDYLTRHFGDPAARVTADRVRMLRAGGASSSLVLLARVALAIVLALLILLVAAIVRSLMRRRHRVPPPQPH